MVQPAVVHTTVPAPVTQPSTTAPAASVARAAPQSGTSGSPNARRACRYCQEKHYDLSCPQRPPELCNCGICDGLHYTNTCPQRFNQPPRPPAPKALQPAPSPEFNMKVGQATQNVAFVEPPEEEEWRCLDCELAFESKTILVQYLMANGHQMDHRRPVAPMDAFFCHVGESASPSDSEAVSSPPFVTPLPTYQCASCQTLYNSRNALFNHLRASSHSVMSVAPEHAFVGSTDEVSVSSSPLPTLIKSVSLSPF